MKEKNMLIQANGYFKLKLLKNDIALPEIIEELEPCRRSIYCGAIGYISQHGHMDTNIAIRTLVCADQHIHCWAGGGIVADSDATSEYQETFDKVAKILPLLTMLGARRDV